MALVDVPSSPLLGVGVAGRAPLGAVLPRAVGRAHRDALALEAAGRPDARAVVARAIRAVGAVHARLAPATLWLCTQMLLGHALEALERESATAPPGRFEPQSSTNAIKHCGAVMFRSPRVLHADGEVNNSRKKNSENTLWKKSRLKMQTRSAPLPPGAVPCVFPSRKRPRVDVEHAPPPRVPPSATQRKPAAKDKGNPKFKPRPIKKKPAKATPVVPKAMLGPVHASRL